MNWKDQAVNLAKEGKSWRKIAAVLGVPKSTCSDYLRTTFKAGCAVKVETADAIVKIKTAPATNSVNKKIIYIPDTQCKPGISFEYLRYIGEYIAEKKPDVIVHAGDHADMESLSSYDKGKRTAEGKRVQADIDAAIAGMNALLTPIKREQERTGYTPQMILTLGNHEQRIQRHVDANPELDGFLGYSNLRYEEMGWEVYDYLQPAMVDGICFIHYFPNPMSGKPYGGSAANMLKQIGTSFVQGHKQLLDVATRTLHNGSHQWGIIAGACLTPDHKVLTADLRYIPLGDVEVGQTLISFDEENTGVKRSRRWKKGTVLAVKKEVAEVFEVVLESGKSFKVTRDHKWLTKLGSAYVWKETWQLRKGTCIPKLMPEWEALDTFGAGWLSGMYDGEGHLHQRTTTGGQCFQLGITQKEGPVLEEIKKQLEQIVGVGNTTHTRAEDNCTQLRIKGGVREMLKVLGTLRPIRLLPKLNPDNMGSIANKDGFNDKVVSITQIDNQEIVRIDIDAKTMIVEGYGHHNCYAHNEGYKGYTGNKHWRGIITLHNVKDGSFDPLFVSLDYLRERYST